MEVKTKLKMRVLRIENKLTELIRGYNSKLRSFLLLGNYSQVKFGKDVRLKGDICFGNNIVIEDYATLKGKKLKIGDNVKIHENVLIRSSIEIEIGRNTSINRNTCILDNVKIGKYCAIAPNVIIVGSNHNFKKSDLKIKEQGSSSIGIIIEDDVWIGANATILDGVRIGRGSVIAAGAVVNKSVSNYSVMGGVPAIIIGKRN